MQRHRNGNNSDLSSPTSEESGEDSGFHDHRKVQASHLHKRECGILNGQLCDRVTMLAQLTRDLVNDVNEGNESARELLDELEVSVKVGNSKKDQFLDNRPKHASVSSSSTLP